MKNLEKKCRIQLYDPDFNQISDRLVSQDTELYKGPLEVHKGPIRIEVSLFEKPDVDSFIEYLKKLQGELPLEKPKGVRGRKPKSGSKISDRGDIAKEIAESTEVLKTLQDAGFVPVTIPFLSDMGYEVLVPKILSKSLERGEGITMVRLIKKAKNPLNNRYDPLLVIFIKDETLYVISDGEITERIKVILSKKVKVPAKAKMRFMPFLTLEERNQFRVDMDKLIKDPTQKPTRLYTRWVHDLAKLNKELGIDLPLIETIPNPYE